MKKNIVYWICKNEYDYPCDGSWDNAICCLKNTYSAEVNIDLAYKSLCANNPLHYAIVTDLNVDLVSRINSKFLSNNIITIDNESYYKDKTMKHIKWILSDFNMNKNDTDDVHVIGDCHFWHKNIIRYCKRPWFSKVDERGLPEPSDEDVEKMNASMIMKWNSVITSDKQLVYINGDFCFGNKDKAKSIFDKLNGRKRLIIGNHDKLNVKDYYDIGFERVYDKSIVLFDFCILSHIPLQWVKDGDVMMNVYAHVHNQEMYKDYTSNSFCTSTERLDYRPISFKKIFEKCKSYEKHSN